MPVTTRKSRRPMTREEAKRIREQKQQIEAKRRESYELSKGPIDVPFCLLVLLVYANGNDIYRFFIK